MEAFEPVHILIVDDDPDTCANLRDILELDGYDVTTAGTAAEALGPRGWHKLSAILLDRRLPDGNAEELLPRLRHLAPQAAVIIVTGHADLEGAINAIRQGAADYITKPINADLIRNRLAHFAERRRAEAEIVRLNKKLQHRLTELQTLLDVIPIGIAISQDPQCKQVRANPALARLLGIPPGTNAAPQTADGPAAYQISRAGKELPLAELPLHRAAAQGVEVSEVDLDIVRAQGDLIHVLAYASPLRDEQGRPRGAVGAFLDISDRKRAQERALQNERLAAIGQMMTGLAHESGNALARSQSCLEMLAWEVEDKPEALDLISRIQKAQDHLRHLYEEVRGYAAPLKLEKENWDVSAVWRQAWENLARERHERDITFREHLDGVNLSVPCDPFRLGQVFRNILENALAACADPVRLDIECLDRLVQGRPTLVIAVADNGPGMNPEQCQRIFEPFFTTKTKGTGLGMAIAKRIIEAHGGQICAGPAAEGGARIEVTLPREAS